VLMLSGLVEGFTFAARIKGQKELLSTLFYLPSVPNVVYSAALMAQDVDIFVTGKAAYPVERTSRTRRLVEAGVKSEAGGNTVQWGEVMDRGRGPIRQTAAPRAQVRAGQPRLSRRER